MASALDIIGGVASVADPVLGWLSNKETNTANREINERNIAANKELQESQFKYNAEMYERALADSDLRNDPLYQRNSYERAGLNPYMMMSNGASRQEISQATGSGSSVPSSIPMQAYQPNFSGLSNAITSIFTNEKLKAETEGIQIDNLTRNQQNAAKIIKLLSEKKLTDSQRNYLEKQLEILHRSSDYIVNQNRESANLVSAQAEQAGWDLFWSQFTSNLDYLAKENDLYIGRATLQRIKADTRLALEKINTEKASQKELYQSAKKLGEDIAGKILENNHNKKAYNIVKDVMISEIYRNLRGSGRVSFPFGTGASFNTMDHPNIRFSNY